MDHYKVLVMDYLQSDRAVFLNNECRLEIEADTGTRLHCACDAVAIDLRHGAVYLCEAALDETLSSLFRKLSTWTRHWGSIKAALCRDCKVPPTWRVHVWLFVPRDSLEMMEERLEQLRHTLGAKFKVKLTALEEVQPWRSASWERWEQAWETNPERSAI